MSPWSYRLSPSQETHKIMDVPLLRRGLRGITPRVGIRLSKYFGVSEGYFSRLQLQYDIDLVKEKEGEEVNNIKTLAVV